MTKVNGRVSVSGKIAYVPQTAWIMNATLKENILFGRDFDKKSIRSNSLKRAL